MPESSERKFGGTANGNDQFDGDSVRQILQRAAVEQHRLDNERTDSYSLEELEEMAAEARISPEALHAAIETHRSHRRADAARPGIAQRPRDWFAALQSRMPRSWSPSVKRIVLTSAGVIALFGLLLTLPAVAQVLFWATLVSLIVLSLLLLLGASPF